MALEGEVVGRREAAGAAAYDADLPARRRGLPGLPFILFFEHVHGHEALDVGYGDGLLDEIAAAVRLAGMRADVAYARGERQVLLDYPDGLARVAEGDLLDVGLAVRSRGAGEAAGAEAVAVVVAHQKLERDLAGLLGARAVDVYDHAVGREGRAGAQQLRRVLGLDDAYPAGAVVLGRVVVAEGRYLYRVAAGDLEYRLALFPRAGDAVYRELYHRPPPIPP